MMMMMMLAAVTTTTKTAVTVTAMVLELPNLDDLASRIYDTKLNYRVAFGNKENPFTMNGLHVKLESNCQTPKKSSTGIHTLSLLSKPWYINENGEQFVQLNNGGWEIGWNTKIKDSKHGLLICSLVSPETYTRRTSSSSTSQEDENGLEEEISKLEQGRFFITHRVWTKQTLELERERRRKIQNEAAQYLNIRDTKVKEIIDPTNKNNFASKMISYAQATQAKNSYFTSGYAEALYIPLYDDQVLELQQDCIVSTRGEIFQVGKDGKYGSKRPRKVGLSRVDFLKD